VSTQNDGHRAPSERARTLVRGAVDYHVHVAPDFVERRISDLDLARRCLETGQAGFGLKSHYTPTTERAQVVAAAVPGVVVLGTITLNVSVGGLNPLAVEGQIEGGTAQGLGLALMEELVTRDGAILNASFTDYLIPTALDMPPVDIELVEEPEPDAPYGAKGVGEPPTVVSTAAILSALRDATGRPLTRVPVRPDDICL